MPRTISSLGLERRRWSVVAVVGALLLSGVLVISASAATLTITTVSADLHDGAVGQTYVTENLVASGGTSPYLWSVVGGASNLPAGLTLSSAGALTGTPTALGNTTFVVKVTDNSSNTATRELTVKVNPPVVVQTTALPPGAIDAPYSQTLLVTGGTAIGYTWALASGSGPLPAGSPAFAISSGGVITGKPTTAAVYNFTVQVTDNAGHSDMQPLSITVYAATALAITTASLPNGVNGTAYPRIREWTEEWAGFRAANQVSGLIRACWGA